MPVSKKRKKKGFFGRPTQPKPKSNLKDLYKTLNALDEEEARLVREAAAKKQEEN